MVKVGCHEEDNDDADKCAKKSHRRPDIDVIRIVLTWAILLFHTALIFSPRAWYYVKIVPEHVPSWHLLGSWLTASMDVWQMPMFFFLSGIRSVYSEFNNNSHALLSVHTMD